MSRTERFFDSLKTNKAVRLFIGIGLPLALVCGLLFFRKYGSPIPCVFYELTGFYCAGCGATRALDALVHFRISDAVGHNIFFVIVLPFVAYYFLKRYIAFVFGKDVLPFPAVSLKTTNVIFVIILLFMIARNIPVYPLTLLAP